MNLNEFSLLKEADDHYLVGHPDGKSIRVSKAGLNEQAHALIKKLKKKGYDDGGEVWGDEEEAPPQVERMPDSQGAAQEEIGSQQDLASQEGPMPGVDVSGALGKQIGAIQAGVGAERKLGQEQAQTYQDAQSEMQASNFDLQSRLQDSQAKQAALEKAYSDKTIDPNRYWKNMDTGSKITSGIAMILGGIGAGLTRGPNYAMESINNAINRDIEAQKNDQSKVMNLWRMNRQATQDDISATLTTQNHMLTAAKVQMMAAAGKQAGTLAQARVAPNIAQIQMQIDRNHFLNAAIHSDNGSEAGYQNKMGAYQLIAPQYYKDAESKYIPGVGVASRPTSADDQNAFRHLDSLNNLIQDAINTSKVVGATVGVSLPIVGPLGTEAYHTALEKRDAIQLELNQLFETKRISPAIMDKANEMIGDPGAWASGHAQAKLKELQNLLLNNKQGLVKSLGVRPFRQGSQQRPGPVIKKMNGIPYQKVQDGWQAVK